MNNWQIVGIILILAGVTVLALLSGFIVTIIVALLKLIAVVVGVLLIVAGVALLFGRRWVRRRFWGTPTAST